MLVMTAISTTVNILMFADDIKLNLRKLRQLGCLNEAIQGAILKCLRRAAGIRQPWGTSDIGLETRTLPQLPFVFVLIAY